MPALSGMRLILTPLRATGPAVPLLLAELTHVRRREPAGVVFTVLLFAAAAVVAWGRFGPYPF